MPELLAGLLPWIILICIIYVVFAFKKKSDKEGKIKKQQSEIRKAKLFNEYDIPSYAVQGQCSGHPEVDRGKYKITLCGDIPVHTYYYIWLNDKYMNLVHTNINYEDIRERMIRIPIKDIEWFDLDGQVHERMEITGGSSKGISVKGALIGGAIAGPVGAVIGGKKGNDPIKTSYYTMDERFLVVKFKYSGTNQIMKLSKNVYDMFLKYMPYKERKYM